MTIDHVLDFFARYPFLWPVALGILWPLVTGILTAALDHTMPRTDAEWSALFASSPRAAALASFLKTCGFNLPGAARALRVMLSGKPPEWLKQAPRTREDLIQDAWRLSREERDALATALMRQSEGEDTKRAAGGADSTPPPVAA